MAVCLSKHGVAGVCNKGSGKLADGEAAEVCRWKIGKIENSSNGGSRPLSLSPVSRADDLCNTIMYL